MQAQKENLQVTWGGEEQVSMGRILHEQNQESSKAREWAIVPMGQGHLGGIVLGSILKPVQAGDVGRKEAEERRSGCARFQTTPGGGVDTGFD